MTFGWIKSVALSIGLVALLSACQPGFSPSIRGIDPAGFQQAVNPCQTFRSGCRGGTQRFVGGRICPPGYRLVRLPYGVNGGPGRDCVLVGSRRVFREASNSRFSVGDRGCGRRCFDSGCSAATFRSTSRDFRRFSCR